MHMTENDNLVEPRIGVVGVDVNGVCAWFKLFVQEKERTMMMIFFKYMNMWIHSKCCLIATVLTLKILPIVVVGLHFFSPLCFQLFVRTFLANKSLLSLAWAVPTSTKETQSHVMKTTQEEWIQKKNNLKKMVSKHELRASLFHSPLIYSTEFLIQFNWFGMMYQISIDRLRSSHMIIVYGYNYTNEFNLKARKIGIYFFLWWKEFPSYFDVFMSLFIFGCLFLFSL